MVENIENPKNNSIEIKKSLKRTIIQLEKAINIINQKSIKDLPHKLTVVENLVNSSNAFVDYLQLKNDNDDNITQTTKPLNNNATLQEDLEQTTQKNYDSINSIHRTKKKPSLKINILLIIALIISLCTNIFLWQLKPNIIQQNNDNNQEKIKIELQKDQKLINNIQEDNKNIIIDDHPIKEEKQILTIPNIIDKQESENNNIDKKLDENNLKNPQELSQEKNNIINIQEELNTVLTPQQFLLNNIQNQITTITNKYGQNLILKIEANLRKNSLKVIISNDWYNFNISQKNNLVSDIFNQAKTFDFYKFTLEDINSNLLARNTVIGNDFIITNTEPIIKK